MDRAKLMKLAMGRVVGGMGEAAKKAKRDRFAPQPTMVDMLKKETPSMVAEAGMPEESPVVSPVEGGKSLNRIVADQGADIAQENSLSDDEMKELFDGAR